MRRLSHHDMQGTLHGVMTHERHSVLFCPQVACSMVPSFKRPQQTTGLEECHSTGWAKIE